MTIKPENYKTKNVENLFYFQKVMENITSFITEMAKVMDEKNLFFEAPYKIGLYEEWMASGVELTWLITSGGPDFGYEPRLVLIWDNDALRCIRGLIYRREWAPWGVDEEGNDKRIGEDKFIQVWKKETNENLRELTPADACETFVALRQLEQEECGDFSDFDDLFGGD